LAKVLQFVIKINLSNFMKNSYIIREIYFLF